MAGFKLADVVVKDHSIWWADRGTDNSHKVEVTEVYIRPDTVGHYFIVPTMASERTYTYKCSWQELSILPLGDELYEVKLWSNSSQYVRSDNAFLTLELTKEQLIEWNANDSWFAKESWYVVRRVGKWTTQSEGNGKGAKRCLQCRYLLNRNDTKETHKCGGTLADSYKPYYTVDESTMATINLR
jgi:hypothetical protein